MAKTRKDKESTPLKDGGGKIKRKAEVQAHGVEVGSPSNQQKRRKGKIKEATIKGKDIAGTLAMEVTEDSAQVAKLHSALESVDHKRRKGELDQLPNDRRSLIFEAKPVPKFPTGPKSEASAESFSNIRGSKRGFVNPADWKSELASTLSFLIQQGKVSWDQIAAAPSMMSNKVLALTFLDLPVDMKIQIVNSYRPPSD